jgi:uncharacterized protein (DUF2345 family)
MDPYAHIQLIFNKGDMAIQTRKNNLLINGTKVITYPYAKNPSTHISQHILNLTQNGS